MCVNEYHEYVSRKLSNNGVLLQRMDSTKAISFKPKWHIKLEITRWMKWIRNIFFRLILFPHTCASEPDRIFSDYGVSSVRRHAIVWTNHGILWIRPLWINFTDIWIKIQRVSYEQVNSKMSWVEGRFQCVKPTNKSSAELFVSLYFF